jgi:Ca2+-transporting ATPase
VLLGVDLDRMTDAVLARRVSDIAVYARVTAEHKLRIVRAWKSRGAIVAMTGDGVNDAPALKEASIGIAMGITGTEVTKEAADIIITDDNFASIVAAVEEGRGIYDNIAKTLAYLLAGNAGELTVMLIAALLGWPLPLLPLHLLWINLVTDGLPALALATDPVEPGVLNRPPRHPEAQLMDREFLRLTALTGVLTAGVTLAAFAYELYVDADLEQARDAAFTVLVIAELMRSFGARSNVMTVWQVGLLSNIRLFLIVMASFALAACDPSCRSVADAFRHETHHTPANVWPGRHLDSFRSWCWKAGKGCADPVPPAPRPGRRRHECRSRNSLPDISCSPKGDSHAYSFRFYGCSDFRAAGHFRVFVDAKCAS